MIPRQDNAEVSEVIERGRIVIRDVRRETLPRSLKREMMQVMTDIVIERVTDKVSRPGKTFIQKLADIDRPRATRRCRGGRLRCVRVRLTPPPARATIPPAERTLCCVAGQDNQRLSQPSHGSQMDGLNMTIDHLLKCVHPLLVDDDSIPEFPYWNIGTGFLVRFNGNLYLITAKHCLQNHKAEPGQISIPVGSGSDEFIRFDRLHRGNAEGSEDYDFADYAIFRAKPGSLTEGQLAELNPFNVTEASVVLPENRQIKNLLVRGYPRVLNSIDYEHKRIPRKSFTFDGTYGGAAGSQHCHTLEYTPHNDVDDPDQLSGSPVFGLLPNNEGLTAKLAGMIILSGKGSKFCQFISAQVLWSALNEVRRQEQALQSGSKASE